MNSFFLLIERSPMASAVKLLIFAVITLVAAYIGYSTYSYYTLDSQPNVDITGIIHDGSYSGEALGTVKGSDDYKVARLSVLLDGKPIVDNVKIGKRSFEYPVKINTNELAQGQHTLDIELVNGTAKRNSVKKNITFNVDNVPLEAAFVKNVADLQVTQGRTLHLQFQTNKKIKEATVKTLMKEYPCFAQSEGSLIYECFVPIDTEQEPKEYLATIDIVDLVGNKMALETKFKVAAGVFKKQALRIEPSKIAAEDEAGKSARDFEAKVDELTKQSPRQKLWHGKFVTPLEIKEPSQITTQFGVIRATQEQGLRQHRALDIYATPKSVIWAPQDGVIVMMDRYAHSGNTVIIDHGYGILSMFFHLDSFAKRQVGEKIKKGNPVGTLGKTGYATGYHLHWEMRINNVAIDPMEWTLADF